MRKLLKIFLIEDNPSDAVLFAEALNDSKIFHQTTIFEDAEAALDHIKNNDKPDLILLDLNLPKMSGLEFLKELKTDEEDRIIPVIILTNSNAQEDVISAYKGYCNAYIRKPIGFEAIVKAIHATNNFWFEIVTLPE